MLSIQNLEASVEDKAILKGVNLTVKEGEIHAVMGPNGSGKSTLASVLSGKEEYEVTGGDISFLGESILDLLPEERAAKGIFLGFQYPVELPGVNTMLFLRTALNEIRKKKGEKELNGAEFMKLFNTKKELINVGESLTKRAVNVGFSGGEKKKNEILQMAVLEPKLSILDETDSGLDIDALKVVAQGVNALRRKDTSTVLITHYQRLLDYIVPDFVHVLYQGKIIHSGDKTLAQELEKKGYDWLIESPSL